MSAARSDKNLDLMQCSGLGIQLAVTLALCTYLGMLLDQWLGTEPILLIVGAFLGLGLGMWSVVKAVDRATARSPGRGEAADDDST